ncbi:unnamed protein product [Didymodactylos carnosus]|uniref:V(D)J recombination-activating protein 1 RNase H domain-containing protein n=1 Tax=Didymodactylos carnosus TaxID=1234261 RepID=A0A813SMH4_9BILA|nr:unnamed protein product [Didymodactylos carnosus]CAF3581212.1 unnamed protein product [Didymodactylos carnosus]
MDFLKSFCNPYIKIPNREYIRTHSKTLLPLTAPWRNNTGVFIQDRELVIQLTVKRIIEMLHQQNIVVPTKLEYREKTGHDGARNMAMYKSVNTPMESANIFSKMCVPLSLTDSSSGEVLWKNESPNSSHWCRPLALIAEKESAELLYLVNKVFEPAEKYLQKNGMEFEYNSIKYELNIAIESSMKDLKVRTLETGLGGAGCLLCATKSHEWKDSNKINKIDYFAISRTAEKTMKLYSRMLNGDDEIVRKKNDYDNRQGLTSKPLSISDQHYIIITHQYINGTQWFLKIIYHLRAHILSWSERGETVKNRVKKAREIVVNEIQASTDLSLDQCDSSGNSGTSTTGGQGRKFFSYELRNSIIKAVPKAQQNNFKRLI